MKIFVSAAEISSDLQAEKIIRSLIALLPENSVEIFGIGGPRLRSLPKFKVLKNAEELRAMGFVEVLSKLKTIRTVLNETVSFLESNPPDLIITFDYPDFHFELLKRIYTNPKFKKTLKICGIPPKVWVWRSHRVEKIRTYFDGVWVIFPFEKKFYEDHGIPVIYSGNPLISDLLKASEQYYKKDTRDHLSIAVMPGSREAELKYHLPTLEGVLRLIAKKTGKQVVAQIPVPEGLPISRLQNYLHETAAVKYKFIQNGSIEILSQNSIGLIKSGTSTLEAAVLGCVPIIFYKANWISEWIFRLVVKYSGPVGLPNILLKIKDRKNAVFPELLGPEATPESLAETYLSILNAPERLQFLQLQGKNLREALVPNPEVPKAVALKILEWVRASPPKAIQRRSRFSIRTFSFIWSTVNAFRRIVFKSGELISIPSVLIGNLQAGGAGKTPLVIELAKQAIARGYRVGVISRGFGRSHDKTTLVVDQKRRHALKLDVEQLGDEPTEILNAVPEVVLGLGADRVALSQSLKKEGVNFLIFDDGFQNLKFKSQVTVLAITDANPSQLVFRDFFSAARHADVLIQTKGLQKPLGLEPRFKIDWKVDSLPSKPIWLLCALADPSEVFQFYQNQGVLIERVFAEGDHARFDRTVVKKLMIEASQAGVRLAVTEKDKVKLSEPDFETLFVLRRKIGNADWVNFIFERLHSTL